MKDWLHRLIHRKPQPVPPTSPALIAARQAQHDMHRAAARITQAINSLEGQEKRSNDLSIDGAIFPDWPVRPPNNGGTEYD